MDNKFHRMLKANFLNSQLKAFRLIIASVFLMLIVFPLKNSFAGTNDGGYKVKKIVIDAGHGGHDTGCLGHSRVNEKVVTLKIALLLGNYIETNFPDVKVIYTRKTDVFVELEERAQIANRNDADLFISIHCNAASSAAYGTETFVMGLHKSEDNLKVAQRENSVIELEENFEEKYQNFDPNAPESYIMFSLTQNAHLIQSTMLAQKIQYQFTEKIGRHNRGVKQAGFWVLWRTAMPAVLIETGFLTNASEEKFLNSSEGQDQIAAGIFRAVSDYKKEVEKTSSNLQNTPPVKTTTEVKETPAVTTINTNTSPPKETVVTTPTTVNSNTINYRVQLMVSSRNLNKYSKEFKLVDNLITETLKANLFRYSAGPFNTREGAEAALVKLKKAGFPDAFITVYKGNEKVPVAK
jgi:N-acetylmuramoyl-L-alanine amidase